MERTLPQKPTKNGQPRSSTPSRKTKPDTPKTRPILLEQSSPTTEYHPEVYPESQFSSPPYDYIPCHPTIPIHHPDQHFFPCPPMTRPTLILNWKGGTHGCPAKYKSIKSHCYQVLLTHIRYGPFCIYPLQCHKYLSILMLIWGKWHCCTQVTQFILYCAMHMSIRGVFIGNAWGKWHCRTQALLFHPDQPLYAKSLLHARYLYICKIVPILDVIGENGVATPTHDTSFHVD